MGVWPANSTAVDRLRQGHNSWTTGGLETAADLASLETRPISMPGMKDKSMEDLLPVGQTQIPS